MVYNSQKKISRPKAENLEALADVLEIKDDYLKGKTDDPSADAADLVPATETARKINIRVNRLSEHDQLKILGMVELATPAKPRDIPEE